MQCWNFKLRSSRLPHRGITLWHFFTSLSLYRIAIHNGRQVGKWQTGEPSAIQGRLHIQWLISHPDHSSSSSSNSNSSSSSTVVPLKTCWSEDESMIRSQRKEGGDKLTSIGTLRQDTWGTLGNFRFFAFLPPSGWSLWSTCTLMIVKIAHRKCVAFRPIFQISKLLYFTLRVVIIKLIKNSTLPYLTYHWPAGLTSKVKR